MALISTLIEAIATWLAVEPVSQSASQPSSHPVSQSARQPGSQPASQRVSELASQVWQLAAVQQAVACRPLTLAVVLQPAAFARAHKQQLTVANISLYYVSI